MRTRQTLLPPTMLPLPAYTTVRYAVYRLAPDALSHGIGIMQNFVCLQRGRPVILLCAPEIFVLVIHVLVLIDSVVYIRLNALHEAQSLPYDSKCMHMKTLLLNGCKPAACGMVASVIFSAHPG